MNCPCPQCAVDIEIDLHEVSERAASHRCSECKNRYWTIREAFTLRSYSKQGAVYCAECGHEMGVSDVCLQCGAMFPDYCIVQSSKPVARKQQGGGFTFGIPLGFSPKTISQPIFVEEKPARQFQMKPLAYVGLAALVLLLVTGLGKFYLGHRAEQQFSKDFVVALYGIKSGTDLNLKKCAAITGEWQAKSGPGRAIAPRLSQKDLDDLEQVRSEIDKVWKKLDNPPQEYAAAVNRLSRLHQVYSELYALNNSSPGSLSSFSESASKLEADFQEAAEELKVNLPDALEKELRTAMAKYRNLRFMVEKA